jgi:fructosamine-3-kinase
MTTQQALDMAGRVVQCRNVAQLASGMGPVQTGVADGDFAMTSISPSCDHYGARLPLTFGLLHGDLWGGNILVTGDQVSGLIDPACYHGHTEVDLAMLGLFDQPNAAFYEAYGSLEPGHDERTPIYRLWPALVHLRLFGTGYRPMVERLLQATGT